LGESTRAHKIYENRSRFGVEFPDTQNDPLRGPGRVSRISEYKLYSNKKKETETTGERERENVYRRDILLLYTTAIADNT